MTLEERQVRQRKTAPSGADAKLEGVLYFAAA
jgi:hypothetical protein